MKNIEIDEKEKRQLSTNKRRNDNLSNPEQKGTVTIEEGYATLRYERRFSHPREVVWSAITDPMSLQFG